MKYLFPTKTTFILWICFTLAFLAAPIYDFVILFLKGNQTSYNIWDIFLAVVIVPLMIYLRYQQCRIKYDIIAE
jgi:hypothetical protein